MQYYCKLPAASCMLSFRTICTCSALLMGIPCFACAPPGDVVQFSLSGRNTGNLRVKGLTLQFAPFLPNISCVVDGIPVDASMNSSQPAIQPGGVGLCMGTYIVTTADIEAGAQDLTVVLQGVSSHGDAVTVERSVRFTPAIKRACSARTLMPVQQAQNCRHVPQQLCSIAA